MADLDITAVTPHEWAAAFPRPGVVYDTPGFIATVAQRVTAIHHLIVGHDQGERPRLGLIAGERDGILMAPFSAPFALVESTGHQSTDTWKRAMELLADYARRRGLSLHITLPPPFYAPDVIAAATLALIGAGAVLDHADYNHHYDLREHPSFEGGLDSRSRNKLRNAARQPWRSEWIPADDVAGVERVYAVIAANRARRGFPLKMTLEQVKATLAVVPSRLLMLSLDGTDVAAALVYIAAPRIAQVIYWGDVEGFSHARPMNMLAATLIEGLRGEVDIIDIGPSSSDGEPNTGLCDFKESLGCALTIKPTLAIKPSTDKSVECHCG